MRTSITQHATYGPQMIDSLKSGPTFSIVTSNTGFENEGGANIRTEHQASVEMIFADGTPGFQEDGGLSNYGGRFTNFPKKSFRIAFRSEFGATKLSYPIFDGFDYKFFPPAEEFDVINLRSGSHDMAARGGYMSNRFTDDSMLDMGNIGPHGRFVHVYLNGKYWGQYHLRERWSADMASSYFGGSKEDYDAVNANDNFINDLEVYDGDGQFWNQMNSLIAGADPFTNAADHLDITNIIDFMLLWVSGGSESEFRSFGSGPQGVPFKFMIKDADGYLGGGGHTVSHAGPMSIMSRMRNGGNPDYGILLADQIHKHFFNDGALTPANNIERLRRRVDERRLGFLSEAARWGDRFRDPPSWESFQADLINNWFPGLTQTMVSRFRSAGMYPSTAAPVFSQHGGHISSSTEIGMSSETGTIYFTTDGSDPRLPGGAINPDARAFGGTVMATVNLVGAGSVWSYLDDGSDQGTAWRESDFDDAGWPAGAGQLGYGDGDESTIVDFGGIDHDRHITTYFRKEVEVSDVASFTSLCVEVLHDDGAVVYLNGDEVVRANMPGGAIDSETPASRSRGGSVENVYAKFDVPTTALVEGSNTIAVEIHQSSATSSDMGFDLRLNAVQTDSATDLFLTQSGPLRARAHGGGNNWSALNEASFIVDAEPASSENLVISEIHYRPSPPDVPAEEAGFDQRRQFEFVELMNIGSNDVELTNVRFTDGITFDFDHSQFGPVIAPGERIVLVNHLAAFQHRYPTVPTEKIAGVFSGNLDNDGEQIVLLAGDDSVIRDFSYNDRSPWPKSADGDGFSLVLVDPTGDPDHRRPLQLAPECQPRRESGGFGRDRIRRRSGGGRRWRPHHGAGRALPRHVGHVAIDGGAAGVRRAEPDGRRDRSRLHDTQLHRKSRRRRCHPPG